MKYINTLYAALLVTSLTDTWYPKDMDLTSLTAIYWVNPCFDIVTGNLYCHN